MMPPDAAPACFKPQRSHGTGVSAPRRSVGLSSFSTRPYLGNILQPLQEFNLFRIVEVWIEDFPKVWPESIKLHRFELHDLYLEAHGT